MIRSMATRAAVIIPIDNPGPEFRPCLGSVKRHAYKNLKIIPVDDASPEPVSGIIEELANNDPRWRPLVHERNLGLGASLNNGLRYSRGSYILLLMQDTELANADNIERVLALLETRSSW